MVRRYWIGPVFGALAFTGFALGQTLPSVPAPAVETQERFVNVQEPGKPAQRCKILKMWIAANGSHAYQVQAVDTGELMTIEDADATAPQSAGPIRSAAMRIFHPGRANQAPLETPEPPASAVVLGRPSDVHATTGEPPLIAAKPIAPPASMATPAKWPSAFTQAKTDGTVPAPDQRPRTPSLTSTELAAPKKVELTPLSSSPVAGQPAQVAPIASVPAKATEMKPMQTPVAVVQTTETRPTPVPPGASPYSPKPVDSSAVQNTATRQPTAPPVVANGSPYDAQPVDGAVVNPTERPTSPFPAAAVTGSPYAPNPGSTVPEAKIAPAMVHWNTEAPKLQPAPRIVVQETKAAATTAIVKKDDCKCQDPQPAGNAMSATSIAWPSVPTLPPPPPLKEPKSAVAKAPTVPAKVDTTPAQPSDWRESWSKSDGPKSPAPPVAAMPKVELPHAEVRADDPLKSPDKYSKLPPGLSADAPAPEKKAPLLALLAPDQLPAAKLEVKQPAIAALPPVPGPMQDAPAPVATPAPVVQPTTAAAETKAPIKAATVAAAPKPAAPAKPAAPLGMRSVLAAASPELAPAAPPTKPKGGSQAEAMGVNADEPNAFTDHPKGGPVAAAGNAFAPPPNPEPSPQTDALANNAFPVPPQAPVGSDYGALVMRTPAPAPIMSGLHVPVSYVAPAGYSQQGGCDLAQLTVVLRESVYPSQREWAVDSLASLDWHKQPQVLDLLMERAKQDPAPTVRAECVRSLGRMKADTLAVVEVVKALQSDEDNRVRQEAVEAYANLSGAPGR